MIYSLKLKRGYACSLLCFLLTFVSAAQGQQPTEIDPNGFNTFYYDNGETASEGYMRNGQPEGYWRNYYESGQLKSEGNRKGHELDSIWKFYSEEGVLLKEIGYQNNLRNGITNTYSPEGFKLSSVPFENDTTRGTAYYYFENSSDLVQFETPFLNGKEGGVGYEFAKNGRIVTVIKYKLGIPIGRDEINRKDKSGLKQGKWKEFHPERIVKLEGTYKNDLKHGYFREYTESGDLITTTKYENGKVVEDAEELMNLELVSRYYENGNLKSLGSYREGTAEGVYREYSMEGEITASKIFKNGRLLGEGIYDEKGIKQGYWKEYYYPSEELKAEGKYIDGLRVEEWVFYHENGKVAQRGKFDKKGLPTGKWVWFYKTEQLLREEYFRNGREDGKLVEYSDSGTVITEGEYIDGLEEGEWVLTVGDHTEKGEYRDGNRHGIWEHHHIGTTKLMFQGEYFDGVPEGKHSYYFSTGKKMLEGKYAAGVKQGEWKRYYGDGQVMVTIEYRDGEERKIDGFKLKEKKVKE